MFVRQASPRREFPLFLRWQAIRPTKCAIESSQEFLHVVPGHVLDGILGTILKGTRVVAHDRDPIGLSYLILAYGKVMNGHCVRALINVGIAVRSSIVDMILPAHDESATRDRHHRQS